VNEEIFVHFETFEGQSAFLKIFQIFQVKEIGAQHQQSSR
jgi:hypothetical protein